MPFYYEKILKSQLNTITVNYIKELTLNDDVEISSFIEGNSEIIKIFCENYRRYKAGEELLYPVNFERGY